LEVKQGEGRKKQAKSLAKRSADLEIAMMNHFGFPACPVAVNTARQLAHEQIVDLLARKHVLANKTDPH
jgi:hypothetical protein